MLASMRTREQNLDMICSFWETLYRRDYWDLQTLLGRAPQWWIQHLATAKPEEWK
jgi:hypothetical protein